MCLKKKLKNGRLLVVLEKSELPGDFAPLCQSSFSCQVPWSYVPFLEHRKKIEKRENANGWVYFLEKSAENDVIPDSLKFTVPKND